MSQQQSHDCQSTIKEDQGESGKITRPRHKQRNRSKKILYVKSLSDNAKLPARSTPGSAGYDLCSPEQTTIPAGGNALIEIKIALLIPKGYYGRIASRSSLALKNLLMVGGGVVDRDYNGSIGVIMFNLGKEDYIVHKHDRVAQIVFERIATPIVVEVQSLPDTERGDNGFGSTGLNEQTQK